jgi:predicted TIM-barrel fold metal-dependent hydrolase
MLAAAPATAANSSETKLFDGHLHLVSDDLQHYPRASGPPPDGAAPAGSGPAPGSSIEAGKPRLKSTVEQVLGWMDEADVDMAAAIQRVSSYGFDNSYVLDSAAAHPDRFRPVVVLDARDSATPGRIGDMARTRNIAGLRLTGGIDATGRYPWMDSTEALRTWAALDAEGLAMDLGFAPQSFSLPALEATLRLAQMFPRVNIVLDHMGRPKIEGAPGYGVADYPAGLSRQRNVYFKLTTENLYVLEEANIPAVDFVRHIVDRFGAGRILWGSNMGTSAGTYAEMAQRVRLATASLTDVEQRQVLRETGRSVFMRAAHPM